MLIMAAISIFLLKRADRTDIHRRNSLYREILRKANLVDLTYLEPFCNGQDVNKSNHADCRQKWITLYMPKKVNQLKKKVPLNVNLCLRLPRKWVGICVTLQNGSIVLLGATLKPLCWSRWLGTNSPGLCKSRWHWILSWECRALYHKETPCPRRNTHTHTGTHTHSLSPREVSHTQFVW